MSSSLGHHRNNRPPLQPPLSCYPLFPFSGLNPPSPKTALLNEHTIKEDTRETKTGKVCVSACVWCSGCEREKARKKSEVLGFVSTAGKSAESGENVYSVRGTVCVRACRIYPLFHCDQRGRHSEPCSNLGLYLLPVKTICMNHSKY